MGICAEDDISMMHFGTLFNFANIVCFGLSMYAVPTTRFGERLGVTCGSKVTKTAFDVAYTEMIPV